MTRHFLLAAILGLLTTRSQAHDSVVQFVDPAEAAPESSVPATDQVDLAQVFQECDATSIEEALLGEALPTGAATAGAESERSFHSVCDCGCSLPSLDRWCDCCPPPCTTPCWNDHPCQCSHGNCYLQDNGRWVSDDAFCDVSRTPVFRSDSAVRMGWWGVGASGSPVKIGEFQDLNSSPFWDVDAISSDGVRTLDMTLSGLDNEANNARANYYGPALSARVDFQRYLRRLDHDPLTGYDLANPAPPGPNDNVLSEDLNVGEDYAIRVQQLDARLTGRLTDTLKWRLNLWGQRKFGERQTNATAHCFNNNAPAPAGADGNVCHVVSQRQTIDWLTMEIQPVLEAQFEDVTVEYSRTMRSFSQDDGTASRQYTRFDFNLPAASGFLGPDYNYALVPENLTQIDRLKINAALTDFNELYANLYVGDTKNNFRNTHRNMNGYDLRLINSSFDQIKLTAYTSRYDETNELPATFFAGAPLAPPTTYDQLSLRHPVDYTRTRAGLKGSWRPQGDRHSYYSYGLQDGTSLAGGYEYYLLERDFATYRTTPVPPGPFTQPDTITHQIEFGPSTRWSSSLNTYIRYQGQFIHVPLIGISEYSEDDPDVNGLFNSNLPEQVHGVDLGGTWTPTDNFMATVQFTLQNSWHRSPYANFTEDNYPVNCTFWYALTDRLSLSTGYAYFSNWIDQDITLGANRGIPGDTETSRWNYAGTNQLVTLSANYAWTDNVQLVGGYEWNRGSNAFSLPLSQRPGVDWTLLPFLSDVIVETNRVTAGADWQPMRHMDVYFRYILFDYDDQSSGRDSGVAHMALGGAGLNW